MPQLDSQRITRALSVRQPWAGLIIHRYKAVENRSWPTEFRGRIAIHASGKDDTEVYRRWMLGVPWETGGYRVKFAPPLLDFSECRQLKNYLLKRRPIAPATVAARGAIIGSVEIVDCLDCRGGVSSDDFPAECEGYLSPPRAWYLGSEFAWILANPVAYRSPITTHGKLNLWHLAGVSARLEESVNAAEAEALEAVAW